jgi:hypothetical protein
MKNLRDLLLSSAARAATYREEVSDQFVFPDFDLDAMHVALGSMRDEPVAADVVIEELANIVEPALVASTGPRYFGYVIGGSLDAAVAADLLTTGWDQNAFNTFTSPGAAVVEDLASS